MTTVTLDDAQTRLAEIVAGLRPGETILITLGGELVARLIAEGTPEPQPRQAGWAKGILVIHAEDDEHLKDFAEYMP